MKTRNILNYIFLVVGIFISPALNAGPVPWAPYLLKDINQNEKRDAPGTLTVVGNILYFAAENAEAGRELWRTDGTETGTRIVKDILPGKLSSISSVVGVFKEIVNIGDIVYFVATDGIYGVELWRTDGTEAGTYLVKDTVPGPISNYPPAELTVVNGILYFEQGAHLWRSDGTEQGTYRINTGNVGTGDTLVDFNGVLYFVGFDGSTFTGGELWKSDGTVGGNTMVKDIYPGRCGINPCGSGISNFAVLNGVLYFFAKDGIHGQALWRSDGTETGTYMVKDADPFDDYSEPLGQLTVVGNFLYFTARNKNPFRHTLWKSDGTEQGTQPVKEFPGFIADLENLTEANGLLWFEGYDAIHGKEPWVSDGTSEGTRMVKNINPNPNVRSVGARSRPQGFVTSGGYTFFTTSISPYSGSGLTAPKYSLWRSDGTEAGTIEVATDVSILAPSMIAAIGEKIYISASDNPISGGELWFWNANTQISSMVAKTNSGTVGTPIASKATIGRTTYFQIAAKASAELGYRTGDNTFTFWKTDGSEEGTKIVEFRDYDVNGVLLKDGNFSLLFTTLGNQLIIGRRVYDASGELGHYLYTSDGTTEGTKMLMRLPYDYGEDWTVIGDYLYYSGLIKSFDPDLGFQNLSGKTVNRTDGTLEGTVELASFITRTRDSSGRLTRHSCDYRKIGENAYPNFVESDGKVFFQFCDDQHGYELWKTDGTPAGTSMVKEIDPTITSTWFTSYPNGGHPQDFASSGGLVYFKAFNPEVGWEPWRSDGTAEGTFVLDVRPGIDPITQKAYSSNPEVFTSVGDKIYFKADDGSDYASISELWSSDGTLAGTFNIKPLSTAKLDDINYMMELNGKVIFQGSDINYIARDQFGRFLECTPAIGFRYGREIWSSDGTDIGTNVVKDIMTVPRVDSIYRIGDDCWGSRPRDITYDLDYPYSPRGQFLKIDGYALFYAHTPEAGGDLWRTDGTENGTVQLSDIHPGYYHAGIRNAHNGNGIVYFTADDGIHGDELWAMQTFLTVGIDVKPESLENCVNFNQHGVIPVAIYGANDLDVNQILPDSLTMDGLEVKVAGKSNKFLVSYQDINLDGHIDLLAKFDDTDNFVMPGTGELEVRGLLVDNTEIRGWDQFCVVP